MPANARAYPNPNYCMQIRSTYTKPAPGTANAMVVACRSGDTLSRLSPCFPLAFAYFRPACSWVASWQATLACQRSARPRSGCARRRAIPPRTCEAWRAWKACISFVVGWRLAGWLAGSPIGDTSRLAIPFHFATN